MSNDTNEWESTKGTGDVWNPTKTEDGDPRTEADENDILDGYYKDIKHDVGPNNATLYAIQQKDGSVLNVWGTKALNDEMDKIRIGQFIRIKWLGKQLTKAGALKAPNKRGSIDSFHNWEVFQSKTVPNKDFGVSSSASVPSTPAAANAVINGGQGIPKAPVNTAPVDDLPF